MVTNSVIIDSREFSQHAYKGLSTLKTDLYNLAAQVLTKERTEVQRPAPTKEEIAKRADTYYAKSSGLVQGLTTYIATWGLHRLSGDAKKFSIGMASDTQYKGKVYGLFLKELKEFSQEDFVLWSDGSKAQDERSLVNLDLSKYAALNRLAMQLSKEWGFWATAILGKPQED